MHLSREKAWRGRWHAPKAKAVEELTKEFMRVANAHLSGPNAGNTQEVVNAIWNVLGVIASARSSIISARECHHMVTYADANVTEGQVAIWTQKERAQAYDWACQTVKSNWLSTYASADEMLANRATIPPTPNCVLKADPRLRRSRARR